MQAKFYNDQNNSLLNSEIFGGGKLDTIRRSIANRKYTVGQKKTIGVLSPFSSSMYVKDDTSINRLDDDENEKDSESK